MKKLLMTFLWLSSTSLLMGMTLHSDGTNAQEWQLYVGDGTIEEVNGAIRLQGDGLSTGYRFDFKSREELEAGITWRLKYQDEFTVYLDIMTRNGRRYLRYTQKTGDGGISPNGRTLRFGTGEGDGNNVWHTFYRNAADDLHKFEPENEFISFRRFFIRGDVEIDDIKTYRDPDPLMLYYLLHKKREALIENLSEVDRILLSWSPPKIIDDSPNIGVLRYYWGDDGGIVDQYYLYNALNETIEPFITTDYQRPVVEQMSKFKKHEQHWQVRQGAVPGSVHQYNGVVELRGDDTNSAYQLNISDAKVGANGLLLRADSLRGMTIYVGIETTKGYRYVRYSDRSKKEGLSANGRTISVSYIPGLPGNKDAATHYLEVEKVLRHYEPDNRLTHLNSLIIRGDVNVKSVWSLFSSN